MCMPYLVSLTIFKVPHKHPLKTWQHGRKQHPPTLSQMSQAAGAAKQPHRLRIWSVFEQRSLLRIDPLCKQRWLESPRTAMEVYGFFSRPSLRSLSKPEGISNWKITGHNEVLQIYYNVLVLLARILTENMASFLRFQSVEDPQKSRNGCSMFILSRNTVPSGSSKIGRCKHFFNILFWYPVKLFSFKVSSITYPYLQQPHSCHPRFSNILPIHRHPMGAEWKTTKSASRIDKKKAHFWTHFKKNKWYLVC